MDRQPWPGRPRRPLTGQQPMVAGPEVVNLGEAGEVTLVDLQKLQAAAAEVRARLDACHAAAAEAQTAADAAFTQAGAVLAPRRLEWASGPFGELLSRIDSAMGRVDKADLELKAVSERKRTGLRFLYGRFVDAPARSRAEAAQSWARAEVASHLNTLGRTAPSPTVADADSLLAGARDQMKAASDSAREADELQTQLNQLTDEIRRRTDSIVQLGFDSLYTAARLEKFGIEPLSSSPIVLKRQENAYLSVDAELARITVHTSFVGGSQGVSLPIGHTGIRYRVGTFKGHPVQESTVSTVDSGQLVLTDQRLAFVGAVKAVSIAYAKVLHVEAYTDALAVFREGKEAPDFFKLQNPRWVLMHLNWLMGKALQ